MVGVAVEVTNVNLKLIYDSETIPLDFEPNEGFDLGKVKLLLGQLEGLGVSWNVVDTSKVSQEELSNSYFEAVAPAIYKKYQVRQVFGSKRHSATLFGKGVPALLVYERGEEHPSDVYPHRAGDRTVTIRRFLEDLLKKLEGAVMKGEKRKADKLLIDRMDRLREKIGPIGVPVAELIREGRRR